MLFFSFNIERDGERSGRSAKMKFMDKLAQGGSLLFFLFRESCCVYRFHSEIKIHSNIKETWVCTIIQVVDWTKKKLEGIESRKSRVLDTAGFIVWSFDSPSDVVRPPFFLCVCCVAWYMWPMFGQFAFCWCGIQELELYGWKVAEQRTYRWSSGDRTHPWKR